MINQSILSILGNTYHPLLFLTNVAFPFLLSLVFLATPTILTIKYANTKPLEQKYTILAFLSMGLIPLSTLSNIFVEESLEVLLERNIIGIIISFALNSAFSTFTFITLILIYLYKILTFNKPRKIILKIILILTIIIFSILSTLIGIEIAGSDRYATMMGSAKNNLFTTIIISIILFSTLKKHRHNSPPPTNIS